MKRARPFNDKASAPGTGAPIVAPREFLGTSNPRYLRILAALLTRARSREDIDRIAGSSNGPAAVAQLRALGLPMSECLPCERTPCYDRDGQEVQRGIYWLTPAGRRRVNAWMRKRDTRQGVGNA